MLLREQASGNGEGDHLYALFPKRLCLLRTRAAHNIALGRLCVVNSTSLFGELITHVIALTSNRPRDREHHGQRSLTVRRLCDLRLTRTRQRQSSCRWHTSDLVRVADGAAKQPPGRLIVQGLMGGEPSFKPMALTALKVEDFPGHAFVNN